MNDSNLPAPIARRSDTPASMAMWEDPDLFQHMQRVAKVFTESELVPDHMRGKLSNCLVAIGIARELGIQPLVVMQNIYFVDGRAGWYTQFLIALANSRGVFSRRISWTTQVGDDVQVTERVKKGWDPERRRNRYDFNKKMTPNITVTATATLAETGEEVSITLSLVEAEAEGWTLNAKYHSIPEQMLRWRTASWLVRLYCPEVAAGLPTQADIEDERAVRLANPPQQVLQDRPARPRPGAGQVVIGGEDRTEPEAGDTTGDAIDAGGLPAVELYDQWGNEVATMAVDDATDAFMKHLDDCTTAAEVEALLEGNEELVGTATELWPSWPRTLEQALSAKRDALGIGPSGGPDRSADDAPPVQEGPPPARQPAETPHDPETGEVRDEGPSPGEGGQNGPAEPQGERNDPDAEPEPERGPYHVPVPRKANQHRDWQAWYKLMVGKMQAMDEKNASPKAYLALRRDNEEELALMKKQATPWHRNLVNMLEKRAA